MCDVHRRHSKRGKQMSARIVYMCAWRGSTTPPPRVDPQFHTYASEPRWRSRVSMSMNSDEFADAGGVMFDGVFGVS